jgi:hypothetical protein
MRILLRTIKAIGLSIIWLIIFFLISGIIANLNRPDFKPISENNIPEGYPVAVYWQSDTGTSHCRAFWLHQLEELKKSVTSFTLDVPGEAQAICNENTQYLKERKQWPVMFEWEQPIRWPYATIEINQVSNTLKQIRVFYTSDDDLHNESRYQVRDKEIINPEINLYFGPGVALAAMPYGLMVTLVLWLLVSFSRRRFRKKASP